MDSHIPESCFILPLLCVMSSLPIPLQNIFSQNIQILSTYSDLLKLVLVHTPGLGSCESGQTFPPLSAEDSPSSSKSHPGNTHLNFGVAQDVIYFWDVFLDLSFIIFSKYSGVIIPKLLFSRPIAFSLELVKKHFLFQGKRENTPLVSVFVSLTDGSVGSKKLSSG